MTSETDPDGAAVPPPISTVLAVVEPEGDAELLHAAQAVAARHGARLDVMSCLEPPSDLGALARASGMEPEAMLERLTEERRARVAEAAAEALGETPAGITVALGKTFIEVIRHVLRHGTDLVVKTAETPEGLPSLFFTSTDQHLLRKCPCPVWLRMPGAATLPRRVIAAVDLDAQEGSEGEARARMNRRVIETAVRISSGSDGLVHVLHAWEPAGEELISVFSPARHSRAAADSYVAEVESARRRALSNLVRPFQRRLPEGPRLVEHLVRGPARRVIDERAREFEIDVIVLGTVVRTGLVGVIIGNTAEDILNTVECSVVAVKPEDFVSPIAP